MSSFSSRAASIWKSSGQPPPPPLDLSILGSGIKFLPPIYWQAGMLFTGARDESLKEHTGVFPQTMRSPKSTHPLFVLQPLRNLAHRVCPCSSKDWGSARVIRKGCVLQYTERVIDRDIFPVESCSFNLPMDPEFTRHLFFFGRVPEECLEVRAS